MFSIASATLLVCILHATNPISSFTIIHFLLAMQSCSAIAVDCDGPAWLVGFI